MNWSILHVADSFAFVAELAARGIDSGVDLILTDPPYPENVQRYIVGGHQGTNWPKLVELGFDPLSREQHAWLGHGLAISRRWVISFCAVEDFGRFQDAYPEAYVRGALWAKTNAMGQLTKDRPATAWEGVACLHRPDVKIRWNGRGSHGLWPCRNTSGKPGRHPNEKPIDLCLKLVALFSERGDLVLDPFCGSAAIGEACVRLGRRYIGLEKNPEWVEKARARLSAPLAPVTDEAALELCTLMSLKKVESEAA